MHGMLRVVAGLTLLLIASAHPVAAMDQSAVEETNCLMACDANQENCSATGHAPIGKYRPRAVGLPGEAKPPQSLRRAPDFSQIDRGKLSKERLQ